jgi:7,8-dihydropterin-6-yl-methyl-4-(beta-D-ribofuranosyl)aminobenzene 5'-phosphate synthase
MSPVESEASSTVVPVVNELVITIVHDNQPGVESLKMAWGFSALVSGLERTILFDTGSDGTLLRENLAKLQLDPGRIEAVVLSHVHRDHTGGLVGLLQANSRVQVYLPAAFPARFKDVVRGYGATVVEIDGPQEIGRNVFTTGVLGRRVKEQALVLRTPRGLIVLTGCAHPGIARILQRVRSLHPEDILLVTGGFHLEWVTKGKVEAIIAAFRGWGVRYAAPTHCSSAKARQLFQQSYGPGYIEVGVGKRLALADLTT